MLSLSMFYIVILTGRGKYIYAFRNGVKRNKLEFIGIDSFDGVYYIKKIIYHFEHINIFYVSSPK